MLVSLYNIVYRLLLNPSLLLLTLDKAYIILYIAKTGLNAVPAVKITLGTPFPGVPAGNDPCYYTANHKNNTLSSNIFAKY